MKLFFKYASIIISMLTLIYFASCGNGGINDDDDDTKESSETVIGKVGKVSLTYRKSYVKLNNKYDITVYYSGNANDVKTYGLKVNRYSKEIASKKGYNKFNDVRVNTGYKNNNIHGYVILKNGKKVETSERKKFPD